MNKLITIILTTYNRAHLIGDTLNSIIAQTYKNWECIIIDDNSTDNTSDILSDFIINDKRFKYIIKPSSIKKGLPASRNIGINLAKGEHLIFFDDDDIIHPQLLELCLKCFEEEKTDFVHYQKRPFEGKFRSSFIDYLGLDNHLEVLKGIYYEQVILHELALASCTVMWKTKLLVNNLFNENLMYAEEWECYSRILMENNLLGVKLNIPLYFNRKHANSNTGEFWNNDPVRVESYITAKKLVCDRLIQLNLMNRKLSKYFISKAHVLNAKKIVNNLLKSSLTYRVNFYLFPIKFRIYKMMK